MKLIRWMMMCGAAAFATLTFVVAEPAPARAQFGINIGGFPIGIRFHGYSRYGRYGRRHRGARDEAADDTPAPGKPEKVAVSKGAPSSAEQTQVLRQIASNVAVSDVGSTKDLAEIGQQSISNDRNRDYTAKIRDIIERFKDAQNRARDTTPGDVTSHAIEQSLEKAVKSAKLDVFERFLNESWTAERVRTMILERVETELTPLFDGNNRGNAPMEALDTLIQKSAEAVFRRIFETSELLAANRSSALFMQRLYQTHGALVDGELRETADRMITRASLGAVNRYEAVMRRDPNGFALRYRAQRVVFDCLSENVERITSAEKGILTNGEIASRIARTSEAECGTWLENQFGTEKSDLKPQRPMPIRVIWSATGPKDDPSMYGRGSGTF
ncbi:MAG: hypothetical protein JO000_16320 [Alphaproteobacteria bacterium]|nr:hypothetical protein [Alphaproteobacteria bacterium]